MSIKVFLVEAKATEQNQMLRKESLTLKLRELKSLFGEFNTIFGPVILLLLVSSFMNVLLTINKILVEERSKQQLTLDQGEDISHAKGKNISIKISRE